MESESIQFTFKRDQMKVVCEHFMKKMDELDEWEISELLDDLIDEVDAGCRVN